MHRDKGLVAAEAVPVGQAGQKTLARPGFPQQQDRRNGRCHGTNFFENRPHARVERVNDIQPFSFPEVVAQIIQFKGMTDLIAAGGKRQLQLVLAGGAGHVVVGTGLDQVKGFANRIPGGDKDQFDQGVVFFKGSNRFAIAGDFGNRIELFEIGKNKVERRLAVFFQGLGQGVDLDAVQ
jgi:pSer/pThr/pTyr-binding forkhead associated (FHA) protein